MTGVISSNDNEQYAAIYNRVIIVAMKQASLEPGLLSAFRLFTILRLGVILPTTIFHFFVGQPLLIRETLHVQEVLPGQQIFEFAGPFAPQQLYIIFYYCIEAVVMVAYLWGPVWPRWLGRFFLPIGLLLSTLGPIGGQYLRLLWLGGLQGPTLAGAWQVVVVLFIPVILIGWQYNFHAVLGCSIGTSLFEAALVLLTVGWNNPTAWPLVPLIFMRMVLYITVGYMICRMIKVQRQQRHDLAQANTRLTHYAATLEQLSVSRERNRLARELHDTLAHTLSGVTVQLEAVKTLWDADAMAARNLLEQSLGITRTGLTETRRALQALRASPLDDLGLSLAIQSLAESLAGRIGLQLNLRLPDHLDDLSPDIEQCVYRVTQEALANIDRHAAARHLTIQLDQQDSQLVLTISDDGRGFSPDEVNFNGHLGLRGMKERAEMVGGRLEVESVPGQGTTVKLVIPIIT